MRTVRIGTIRALALLLFCAASAAAQEPLEVRLWPDGAPGSEDWSAPESVTTSPGGDRVSPMSATRL